MKRSRLLCKTGLPLVALVLTSQAFSAFGQTWGSVQTLQGPFTVLSPPEPPWVAMNANGHALSAWADTGVVQFAEKLKGAAWTQSLAVPGGAKSAGLVALAMGNNEVSAIAFATAATRHVPSKLEVSLRLPGGAFAAPVEPVPGAFAWDIKLGIACDGSVTLVWNDTVAVWATRLAGTAGKGACDGLPGPGPWSPAVRLSSGPAGSGLADLATNDAGAALAVWQEGGWGTPTAILAALQTPQGVWQPADTASAGTGKQTWNPKPGIDAAGNAAVGYLDGNSMVVARKSAGQAWAAPELVSGSLNVYYPSLAMSAKGDLLAAWMAYDTGNVGTIWSRMASPSNGWAAMQRRSRASENAHWPSSAFSPDGQLAVIGWTDDASNTALAAVWSQGRWKLGSLGGGWWGSTVPVAAGAGAGVAGWAKPKAGNVNSATLFSRTWE